MENIISFSMIGSISGEVNTTEFDIIQKYLKMINVISSQSINEIESFFNENPDMYQYLNSFFFLNGNNNLYPIHYLFSNKYLTTNMIDFFFKNNCKLSYLNEPKTILFYLLNNKYLSNSKILNILEHLKLKNFDFTKKDKSRNSVYHYLANSMKNSNKILSFIFENNSNLDDHNNHFETPLLISTRYNNTFTSVFLLKHNCNVNKVNNNNNTALMYSCMNSNGLIASTLLNKGAEINFKDNQNDICFFYACGCDNKGSLEINLIKYLYLKGADINMTSHENYSCLHYAAGCLTSKCNCNILNYLISIGVNTDIQDVNGCTFLDYVLKNENDIRIIKQFIKSIKLSIPLKNSLIINNFDAKKYICKTKSNLKNPIKCNISHINLENGDKFYKCDHNHCFDSDYLLEWYKESRKYVCPLCFSVIDLSVAYEVE